MSQNISLYLKYPTQYFTAIVFFKDRKKIVVKIPKNYIQHKHRNNSLVLVHSMLNIISGFDHLDDLRGGNTRCVGDYLQLSLSPHLPVVMLHHVFGPVTPVRHKINIVICDKFRCCNKWSFNDLISQTRHNNGLHPCGKVKNGTAII